MKKNTLPLKILFISSIGLILIVFSLTFLDDDIILNDSYQKINANNSSSVYYKIIYKNSIKRLLYSYHKDLIINMEDGKELVEIIKGKDGFFLKPFFKEGRVSFKIQTDNKVFKGELEILDDTTDYDLDGFPDSYKLVSQNDRENFIDWFVVIAESQFYVKSYQWYKIHYDCAGLIVFAYKEALKKHSSDWFKNFPYLSRNNIPDILRFNYPEIPVLGIKLFRNKSGKFQIEDLKKGVFTENANVNILLNFNLNYISKEKINFQRGDILFFNRDNNTMPYHSMIYSGEEDILIYHTGPVIGNPDGEVRRVKFETLMQHPDKIWHPVPDNPNFLGAYRWKIIM